jgi:hypothetical protein
MLRYNTHRPDRFLRTKFVEGRYLLASENTDLELEILDLLRSVVKNTVGDIAIADAWKVERLSATELLIKPGEAWYNGLPFSLRGNRDQLVTGSVLGPGILPTGVAITDDASGLGKILTFSTAPSTLYRIIITAQEEVIDDIQDPFLKNINVPEATGQKVRLVYRINVVQDSIQTETPIPYTTDTGAYNTANLTNRIAVTPVPAGNGELLATNPISGSQQIDGRNLELVVRNILGTNPMPKGSDTAPFANGFLVDSQGNSYRITAILDDPSNTANQSIIRIDKEVSQPNPVITNGQVYYLTKADVYYTDSSENPIGRMFWHIAKANWTGSAFTHDSAVTDLRTRVITEQDFEHYTNTKFTLTTVGGGTVALDIDGQSLSWTGAFSLINPSGPAHTVNAGNAVLIDGGTLSYVLNLASGGVISVGNLAVTVTSGGSTLTFSGGPDLSAVKIGNIIKVGTDIAQITAIDNIAKTVVVSPSVPSTGAGTIYRDSFAPGTAPSNERAFTLAALKSGKVVIGNALQLEAGRSNAIYDERTQYPTGLVANTNITIPVNSRSGLQQYYDAVKGDLEVYANQVLKFQGTDWIAIDNKTIQFSYALSNDTEVHFRMDSNPQGSLGGPHALSGGGGSLQSAYNAGNTISTASGTPVTISGAASKQLQIIGDMGVTGVIDPTGVEFTSVASNPLGVGTNGLWFNNLEELIVQRATNPALNVGQILANAITNLIAGAGLTGGGVGPTTTIDVNVDGVTLEINSDAVRIKDGGVTNAKVAAGIDALKIGAGLVDNTEFGYLNGATSNIQAQINSVAGSGVTSLTGDVTGTGPGATATTIANNAITAAKINTSAVGSGLAGGGGTPLSVVSAPVNAITAVAGESFAANNSYLVRWARNGETAGRVYKATSLNAASDKKCFAIGIVMSTSAISAGNNVTVITLGTHTLGSSDSTFGAFDQGSPVFLTTAGGYSLNPPSTSLAANYIIGTVQDSNKIWVDMKQLTGINE